jgi:CheY-like chemotaxis protein
VERIPDLHVNVFTGEYILKNQPLILVVEDDWAVQMMIEDALDEGGFEPAITASGEEAVTLLKGNMGIYRALVADIGLRGRMTGWEVATRARLIDPEFPVLYITGAYAHQWGSRGVANSALPSKPFAPPQLVAAVSQMILATI